MWARLKAWTLLKYPHSLLEELNPCGPKRWRAIRFLLVLAFLLGASVVVSKLWIFEYAGLRSADVLATMRPVEQPQETGLVMITANEREHLLGGVSPIPATKLLQAVCAVLKAKPKVLAVDLDTARIPLPPLKMSTKIVWARGLEITRTRTKEGRDTIEVKPDCVLGKASPEASTGLAVAPVLDDWSVRSIPLCHEYAPGRVMPTLVAEIAKAAGEQLRPCGSHEESHEVGAFRIHYRYDRFTLSDFEPEKVDARALDRCQRGVGEWAENAASSIPPLKDLVVVLGGEYDAMDWHPTPAGLKPGAEVVASFTEHLLRQSGSYHLDFWLAELPLKLLFALVIAWIHCKFRPMAALLFCLLGLSGLVLTGGLLTVYLTSYRATMVPFLIGILIEQLVTSAEKAQEGE